MTRTVDLIGLDFGTTTSSAVVATAELAHNAVTGRSELSQLRECYRSEMVFTPMRGDGLDLERLDEYLDEWLHAGGVQCEEIFGGGALLTGLTAQKANAAGLVQLIERRLGDALIVTAEDPCFESWLAFMGSCAGLAREHPDRPIINLDIGGGTTNIALGQNGEVLRTGCLFVGARHVQVEPGTYRITRLSKYAAELFKHLDIEKAPGDVLAAAEVGRAMDFYVTLLEAAVSGGARAFEQPVAQLHRQVAFRWPDDGERGIVTLSGGVGELVYAHLAGQPWPATTCFGDLGIELAQRLLGVAAWSDDFRKYAPSGGGRATAFGLLRHATQVSGNTLFLPDPGMLPLKNVPIFGSISPTSHDGEVDGLISLVRRSPAGGCIAVKVESHDAIGVREVAMRLARALANDRLPANRPLVLLVEGNVGKALGHCVTDWGRVPLNLVVIDEIAIRDAQFVRIGSLQNQVVPVSFYGMNES